MTGIDSTKRIAVMTSIAPINIDNQRLAVSSWLAAGFEVMSYNCSEEIEKLSPFFKDIEFIEAKRDARDEFGKPYVYFSDIMSFFESSSYEICGIINSDIHIRGLDQRFIEFIKNEAIDSLVFGQRVEVDNFDDLNGRMYIGFDYFFFNRSIASIYPEEKFCIGQPVWDYWIIVMAVLNNIKAKKLLNPIAYHVRHSLNWNEDTDRKLTGIVLNKYISRVFPALKGARSALNKEYRKMVFQCNEEICYMESDCNRPSVLIVLEDLDVDTLEGSATFRSIRDQRYKNIRLLLGSREKVDFERVGEEYVWFVKDGLIPNKYFLELMTEAAKGNDYVACGMKVIYEDTMSVDFIYPTDAEKLPSCDRNTNSGFVLYRTEFLKRLCTGNVDYSDLKADYVGQGLIESIANRLSTLYADGRYAEIIEEYKEYCIAEAQYYVGQSYIAMGREKAGMEYLFKFIGALDNCSSDTVILAAKIFNTDAFFALIETYGDKLQDSKFWDRILGICMKHDNVRFSILCLFYNKKYYEGIMIFEGNDGPDVNFYMGRTNKDLHKYEKAIGYLAKYIKQAEAVKKEKENPIFNPTFLLSAYFHLGEIYGIIGAVDFAEECFENCQRLSNGTHRKAGEYLRKLRNAD